MSILIRGMQKPKDCELCPFEQDGFPDEWEMHCKLLGRQVGYFDEKSTVPKDCPIIEVPTPHGRLIDADRTDRALSELRWEGGDWRTGKLKHWGDRPDWCLTGAEVESLITAAPTIIEAEEGAEK